MNTETMDVEQVTEQAEAGKHHTAPTIQEVLEWAKERDGVVVEDWVANPLKCEPRRIVFPSKKDSTKSMQTCQLVKDAVNKFYPYIVSNKMMKHSCVIQAKCGESVREVWILESNLQIRIQGSVPAEYLRRLDFPSHRKALDNSTKSVFLSVPGVRLQGR